MKVPGRSLILETTDLQRFGPGQYFNDEIVNFFSEGLNSTDVLCLNSFFAKELLKPSQNDPTRVADSKRMLRWLKVLCCRHYLNSH